MTKLYIAGAEGFIGSHLQEYVRETTDWEIVPKKEDSPDYVVHLGGNSQIDDSIADSFPVTDDIHTTIMLLNWAKTQKQLKKFLYFSSDEVFGPKEVIEDFSPSDRYNSHSPYAAGKAACEEMCLAWASTYGVPTVITHCQNLFGERQPANKFVPTVVRCALTGGRVPIYASHTVAKRNFLHVRDACSAIMLLLDRGWVRHKYNIATRFEIRSEDLVRCIATVLGVKIETEIRLATNVRPGIFLQHGLNGNKLIELGWDRMPLAISLPTTVRWMAQPENRHWLGL